jgi:hypothetical protein
VPRKTVKKDGKYKDRAEMRRLGLDDEYKPVRGSTWIRRSFRGAEDALYRSSRSSSCWKSSSEERRKAEKTLKL